MISQLTVFLENDKGRLASACRVLSDAGVNLHALNLADTADFGVARVLADTLMLLPRRFARPAIARWSHRSLPSASPT